MDEREAQQAPDSLNGRHVQNNRHSDPYIAQGNTSVFHRSNTYQMLPPSQYVNRSDLHYLPDHVSWPAFYRNASHNQPNHPLVNHRASDARTFHVPLSYGFVLNLPSSSYYNGNVLPVNDHGMSNNSEAGVRGFRTESTMSIPGNPYHLGESARPSTSAAPLIGCPFGPWSASIEAPLYLSNYRGYGNLRTMEVEARRRSDTVGHHMNPRMLHSYNNLLLQGYCVDESFLAYCTLLDQQSNSNAGGLLWNGPPMTPYSQGSNVQGVSSELSNSSLPIHPQRSINHVGGSTNFLHSSRVSLQHPNHHLSQNTPANRVSPLEDDVLILEEYNDNSTDHVHSNVDNFSYEDLLALSERIGTANIGLTEEDIIRQLKTRQYSAIAATIDQEQLPCLNQDHDSCIICQDEYEVGDKLGILECRHEFHLQCLKKWLLIKNVCPLCKSTALVA